jgi:Metallo-peptidase family M12/WW domain
MVVLMKVYHRDDDDVVNTSTCSSRLRKYSNRNRNRSVVMSVAVLCALVSTSLVAVTVASAAAASAAAASESGDWVPFVPSSVELEQLQTMKELYVFQQTQDDIVHNVNAISVAPITTAPSVSIKPTLLDGHITRLSSHQHADTAMLELQIVSTQTHSMSSAAIPVPSTLRINLKRKMHLLPDEFLVYDNVGPDSPPRAHNVEHCYYGADINGDDSTVSWAALHTCGTGAQGMLIYRGVAYHVHHVPVAHIQKLDSLRTAAAVPAAASTLTGTHAYVLVPLSELKRNAEAVSPEFLDFDTNRASKTILSQLTQQHSSSSSSSSSKSSSQTQSDSDSPSLLQTRSLPYTIEYVLTIDRGMRLRYTGSVSSSVTALTIILVNQIDGYFQATGVGIRVLFKSLILNLSGDPYTVSSSASTTLANYKAWIEGASGIVAYDAAAVLIGSALAADPGRAYTGAGNACGNMYSANADVVNSQVTKGSALNIAWTSNILAHELAHNMGAAHTSLTTCDENEPFIMNAVSGLEATWSTCTTTKMAAIAAASTSCLTVLASDDAVACGSGFFDPSPGSAQSSRADRCTQCHPFCASCTDAQSTSCTRCYAGKALQNGECRKMCTSGFYSTFSSQSGRLIVEATTAGAYCTQCSNPSLTCPTGQITQCDSNGANSVCATPATEDDPDAAVAPTGSSSGGTSIVVIIIPIVVVALAAVGILVYVRRRRPDLLQKCMGGSSSSGEGQGNGASKSRQGQTATTAAAAGARVSTPTIEIPEQDTNRFLSTPSYGPASSSQPGSRSGSPLALTAAYHNGTSTSNGARAYRTQSGQPDIPPITGMEPAATVAAAAVAQEPSLPENWVEYVDDDGNPYYWNSVSNESTWDHPGYAPGPASGPTPYNYGPGLGYGGEDAVSEAPDTMEYQY